MDDRLSTGIEALDRQIGGGIRVGSVVVVRTPPESQGEILLREVATEHPALYLSTTRSEDAVRGWFDRPGLGTDGVDVRYVGGDGLADLAGVESTRESAGANGVGDEWTFPERSGGGVPAGTDGGTTRFEDREQGPGPDEPIEAAVTAVESVGGATDCVVVDPVNPLEGRDASPYKQFLHWVQRQLVANGSVGFFHVVDSETTPDVRWLTLQIADEVWSLSVDSRNEQVEFRLAVTKSRGGNVPDRRIKLELGTHVTVDTSRDIA